MRLLALETATDLCSVAIVSDDHQEVVLSIRRPRAHSEHLMGMVDEALKLSGCTVNQLDGVAVSSGPGSYTGLRIGVSAAKGLCFAAELPLVGVPTMEAMAYSVSSSVDVSGTIAVALKSRRGEVYGAIFEKRSASELIPVLPPSATGIDLFINAIRSHTSSVFLTGDAVSHLREAGLEDQTLLRSIPLQHTPFSATWIGRLGRHLLAGGHQEDVAAFEPSYLKNFVAKKPTSIFDRLPDMSHSGARTRS